MILALLVYLQAGNSIELLDNSTPKSTQFTSLAYNTDSKAIFIYGGLHEFSEYSNNFYSFDTISSAWSTLHTSSSLVPGPRMKPYITFYPSSDDLLLYGGTTPRGPISDIWILNMPTQQVNII